jgi:hypothetical protein
LRPHRPYYTKENYLALGTNGGVKATGKKCPISALEDIFPKTDWKTEDIQAIVEALSK